MRDPCHIHISLVYNECASSLCTSGDHAPLRAPAGGGLSARVCRFGARPDNRWSVPGGQADHVGFVALERIDRVGALFGRGAVVQGRKLCTAVLYQAGTVFRVAGRG